MRIPMIMLVLAISAPAASAGPSPPPAVDFWKALNPINPPKAIDCPRTTTHYADQVSSYRGERVPPKKLTELPPAVGYMAVFRTVNGCEVPMTIIEYRTGRRL